MTEFKVGDRVENSGDIGIIMAVLKRYDNTRTRYAIHWDKFGTDRIYDDCVLTDNEIKLVKEEE